MRARAPGRRTRPNSAKPAVASSQWCIEKVLTTLSNDASPKGSDATSAARKVGRRSARSTARNRVPLRALDHRRVEVDTGHIELVPIRERDRQVTRAAAHLQDPRSGGNVSRDVGSDPLEERPKE